MGLELADVPCLGCLQYAHGSGIQAATKVAAAGLHPPLAASLRIHVQDGDADATQIADEPDLLQLPRLKQTQHAPAELGACHPAKVKPQGAFAFLADDGGPQVGTETVPIV